MGWKAGREGNVVFNSRICEDTQLVVGVDCRSRLGVICCLD